MEHNACQIVEFQLDYKKVPDSADQARLLLDFVTDLISNQGKRVALSYSAHNGQAQKIYAAYAKGNNFHGCIHGRNQAACFEQLTNVFPAGLRPQFRVLPFATIMKSTSEDDPVGTTEVIRDLSNLVQHFESGWTIVMLTNPKHLRSTSYFQIGGGKALHFYHASKRCIPLNNMILSQGLFVERIVKLLQNGDLEAAKRALKPFQDVLLGSDIKAATQLSLADQMPLVWWVRKQLVKTSCLFARMKCSSHFFLQVELNLLPGSGSAISDVLFSPSFNLRVACESEAVLKSLQKPLSKFRAESLENARTAQLSKTNKKSAENIILSIPADQIVPFLADYCKIPFDAVGCELAKRIRKGLEKKKSLLSRASVGDFVVITPLFVVFGDSTVVSVEEALDRKLFGAKYSKKDVDIDPTVAAVIVKALQLSSTVGSKPADYVQLRYSPWLPSESETYDEEWKEVVKRYNRYTATLCNVFKV